MKNWRYFAWMLLWLPVGAVFYFSLNLVVYKYFANNNFAYLFNSILILGLTILINVFLLKKTIIKNAREKTIFYIVSGLLVFGIFVVDFLLAATLGIIVYGM
jgi:hypothetical protein